MMTAQTGTLFIVATPIGNLKDMTDRAQDILKGADLIACEDSRHTGMLLKHFDIRTKMISFHDHSHAGKTDRILSELLAGKHVALVSDAGTPLISDPGFPLVRDAIQRGIRVEGIPGPCAAINALVLSGFACEPFSFFGFLPPKDKKRRDWLNELVDEKRTLVFYESPYRLLKTLQDIADIFGDRRMIVAREMTKKFEDVIRGSAKSALNHYERKKILGEIVIVIEGVLRKVRHE